MLQDSLLKVDSRSTNEIVADILARRFGYLPQWRLEEDQSGEALVQIAARFIKEISDRLNLAPEKNLIAFLDTLGIPRTPARAARAPVVFSLAEFAPPGTLPTGAQVAAPPPPEASDQLVFEAERGIGLTSTRIRQLVSLWPGRDQYIDHTQAFLEGSPVRPFERRLLEDTAHSLYIGHSMLLAMAGTVKLDVEFEFSQFSSEPLSTIWEYWDGKFWRAFNAQIPECGEKKLSSDGVSGFRRNGRVQLETDCAESALREVNRIESMWIRARLNEALPRNPKQILPEITQVRLASLYERQPSIVFVGQSYVAPTQAGRGTPILFKVVDTNGLPISVNNVLVNNQDEYNDTKVAANRIIHFDTQTLLNAGEVSVSFNFNQLFFERTFEYKPLSMAERMLVAEVQIETGLQPDGAFANSEKIKLTQPYFPFGAFPQTGASFYFSHHEAFSKPGAKVAVLVQAVDGQPQQAMEGIWRDDEEFDVKRFSNSEVYKSLTRRIAWEYWNGKRWATLPIRFAKLHVPSGQNNAYYLLSAADLNASGIVEFVVPSDLKSTKVNDEEQLWVRVRLMEGTFGINQTLSWKEGTGANANTNSFVQFIALPPVLADLRLTYVWEDGPKHPEHVIAYNDFQYIDHSETARWPGTFFKPFEQVADSLPAFYIGHDQPLPVDRINLFFDLVESHKEFDARSIVWEYWNGANWRELSVEDETVNLEYAGMVSLLGPGDGLSLNRFGQDLYWIRARYKEDGPPPVPTISGIHFNAAWVAQRQTIVDESIGQSKGIPNQSFFISRVPILEDPHRPDLRERIEVRELLGNRATVQWRTLANEIFQGDKFAIAELEKQIEDERLDVEVKKFPIRLVRDRFKRVVELWVEWSPQLNFRRSLPGDRHYTVDRPSGRLAFGNGRTGLIPPLGSLILARSYCSGGGIAGNVPTNAISQALTGVAGLESIFNPRPAEGGSNSESLASYVQQGPKRISHRGRAITQSDFETLTYEASPTIAAVSVIPNRDDQNRYRAGHVKVVIIPKSEIARPVPSPGLRDEVRKFLESHADACVSASDQSGVREIYVTGPDYFSVDVSATVAPKKSVDVGQVEANCRAAIERFLHPLTGGPNSTGWPMGRDVYLSDLAAVLERTFGVDFVMQLELIVNGAVQGESAKIPTGKVVASGDIQISLVLVQ